MAARPPGSDLPNARRSARSVLLQGLEHPARKAIMAPARVSPHTIDAPTTRTPYHAPTLPPRAAPARPAPAPSAKAKATAARLRAGQAKRAAVAAPTLADKLGGAARSVAGNARQATAAVPQVPVASQPVAPPPAAPAGPAAAPAANANDPYADLPPEIAALLHAHDHQTDAQAGILSKYYGDQATAAQAFAGQIAPQLQGLATMSGMPVGPQAAGGAPGAVASMAPQLNAIGGKMLGAQGFDVANAAAVTPTFLRQAGSNALASLYGSAQEAGAKTMSDYVTSSTQAAGDLAKQQMVGEQQAAGDARDAVLQQGKNAIAANNAQLGFLGRLLTAAISSGDKSQVNQVRQQIAQVQADSAQTVAGIRAAATTGAAQTAATSRESVAKTNAAAKAKKDAAAAKKGKPIGAGTRTAIANAFGRIWNGDPSSFTPGVATTPDASPEEKGAATTATVNFMRRYHENFPGPNGLAQLMTLLPADAAKLAQQWFQGQTGPPGTPTPQRLKALKKIWP